MSKVGNSYLYINDLDNMLLKIVLIFGTIFGVKGQCSMHEHPKTEDICNADIFCDSTTVNIDDLINNWSCIKSDRRYYNPRTYSYDYETDDQYNLNVKLKDVDINVSEDPLSGISEHTRVKTLYIDNGNLVAVPFITSRLVILTEFSLTNNKVETVNLSLVSGVSMQYLNLSHNCISKIENEQVGSTVHSYITTIDLSYNEIESLPDSCFEMFSQLKYLDFSFNMLVQFDILTFEGITQLETLRLSNNKLSEIGQNLARFRNLKILAIDQNKLTSLTDINFRTLISLEKLNLSANLIKNIEDQSFAAVTNLEQLDLSHNQINDIRQVLFKNNENLYDLSLSHNYIDKIEGGAFRTTNISNFDIQNNIISGTIEYDTFLGIFVESMDLSNGKLRTLGDKAFSALGSNLRYLNLSANLIENINVSAFQSLGELLKLDLSSNNIIDIEYNTRDLVQLTEYYLHINKIKKIAPIMFRNMTNLVRLDLSQNKIVEIETNSFVDLKNLRELNMSRNHYVDTLTSNMFRGLYKVKSLDLSNTRLMQCLNQSFSGMVALTFLNLSHSQIETIEYDTFRATGAIKIIDLSYNMLKNFHINTSSISQLTELYLSHNTLKILTGETLKNLHHLEKVDLAFNNILSIKSNTLQTLSHLRYFDLYSNKNLKVMGDIFNNLVLSRVTLSNVRQPFNFNKSINASVTSILLSNCGIEDINSIFVYKFGNVLKLDISSNKIKVLDKGSFQNMFSLNWLDISSNMISTIQPGTFLTNNMINNLNLYGNNLKSLQFGVLDGLRNLRVLNLSNNEIHIFGVNLLHNSPYLSELFLENNKLSSMDLRQLSVTSVELLTIGGNSISCDEFADWNKLDARTLNVTAERFDFDSENVLGISCKTNSLREETKAQNTQVNVTSELIEMRKTVEQLYSYFKITLNETMTKITTFLEHYQGSTDKISGNLNNSQMAFSEHIIHFLNENKHLLPQLVNSSENVSNEMKVMINLLEKNNNLTTVGNIDKELLQSIVSSKMVNKETNKNFTDFVMKLHSAKLVELKPDTHALTDIKALLYFIAVCLAIVILFGLVTMTYIYLYKKMSHRTRESHLYDSGQSVRTGLEMQ